VLLLAAWLTAGCPGEEPAPARAEGRPSPLCPDGALLFGEAPPAGREQWCRIQTEGGLWINHGPHLRYHASGNKSGERMFEKGKLHGAFTSWDDAGHKLEQGEHLEGQPHGVWLRFSPAGEVVDRRRYDRGRVAPLQAAAGEAPAGAEPATEARVGDYEAAELFFWKVTNTKKKRRKSPTVYLLGSIHVGHYGVFPMDPTIEKAFDGSGTLAIEAYGTRKDARWEWKYYRRRARLKPGTTLKEVIDEDLWDPLVLTLERNGLDLDKYTQFKPWVVAHVIGGLKADAMRVDDRWGIDRYFLERAQRGGKKVVGLEKYRAHVKLFDRFPMSVQNMMLRDVLRSAEEQEQEYKAIHGAWKRGDPDQLEKVYLKPMRDDPKQKLYYERMIVARNKIMARSIGKFLKRRRGSLFAIAGAAHMIGDEGVPAILEARGFRVEQQLRWGL